MDASFTLPDAFWSGFVRDHWEKKPALLKKVFAKPVATAEETMPALIRACDSYRINDRSVAASFYIEAARVIADAVSYMPESRDNSLDEYARRIRDTLQGRRFGLIVEQIQMFYPQLWLGLLEFLRGLYRHTGLPAMDSKATIFMGDYEKTPVGLHRGRSSNFMFVVHGKKRIRLWMDDSFQGRRPKFHILDYDQYLDRSILMEGEPGDVIYWPSSCWHIGESGGGFSAGISLALFRSTKAATDLITHSNRLLQQKLKIRERTGGFHFPLSGVQDTVKALPGLAELARFSVRETAEDPQLVQSLRISWLNYLSAFGFGFVPPPAGWQTLKEDDVVSGYDGFPVFWMPLTADKLVCSARGHAFQVPAHLKIIRMLEHLNTGAVVSIGNLLQQFSVPEPESDASPLKLRLLMEKLLSLRAIRIA